MSKISSKRELRRFLRGVVEPGRRTKQRRRKKSVILVLLGLLAGILLYVFGPNLKLNWGLDAGKHFENGEIPTYSGKPYVELNQNKPLFTAEQNRTKESFEEYSELDLLGRCGVAFANLGLELMPDEEREAIGSIKPSGWHTAKYPELIEDLYLYNRCHLIAFSLSGENANEKNLITGTRYLNVEGMLPFETKVANYIRKTGNHVLYRVTPVFEQQNLVASGVIIEAYSVEDQGKGICFNVYVFNVQPGISIDYSTGDSRAIE